MNKVILIGRLTKDIELRGDKTKFAKFNIAVNRQFKKNEVDYVGCTAFNKTAEMIEKYFEKGDLIAVEGSIQTGSYEKDGKKVYTTTVLVYNFHFSGKKEEETSVEEDMEEIPF